MHRHLYRIIMKKRIKSITYLFYQKSGNLLFQIISPWISVQTRNCAWNLILHCLTIASNFEAGRLSRSLVLMCLHWHFGLLKMQVYYSCSLDCCFVLRCSWSLASFQCFKSNFDSRCQRYHNYQALTGQPFSRITQAGCPAPIFGNIQILNFSLLRSVQTSH